MHEIIFYEDAGGRSPVAEYIRELKTRGGKDSRIKLDKINDCIGRLEAYGTFAGMPYVEHIDGEIWELRPLRDRIFFAAWVEGGYVLLHHFLKRTPKTPKREIEKAKRELADFRERRLK